MTAHNTNGYNKLCIASLGFACGLIWGLGMLLVGWIAAFTHSWGHDFIKTMSSLYIGFNPSFSGGIVGGVLGFLDAGIGGAIFAWIYNFCLCCCSRHKCPK